MPFLTIPPKPLLSKRPWSEASLMSLETKSTLSSANISRALQEAKQSWWQQKSTSIFYAFEAQHQRLEAVYSFRNKQKILRFLETKQFLILLLLEARFHIAKFFPGSEVFLEIDTDPEAPTDEQLVAFIATSLPSNEALARLKQLDEDWWLNALDRAQGKLCITVEFQ
ncbi:MAG: hypothetical protein JOZ71_08565 [Ktedonobacteraceae bacterium]|nr:hypothetical protein [Ktedonobacteraceae bacterium]